MNTKKTKTVGIEPYIIEVMCLRFSETVSLAYLKLKGYEISRAEFYNLKQEIKDNCHTRLNLIASKEFLTQHIERIDMLKTILNEMWKNYHAEKNPLKRVQILEKIEENQIYLSSYYDSTRYVMEQAAKAKQQDNQNQDNQELSDNSNIKKKRKKELNQV
jgi:hypothetical protein